MKCLNLILFGLIASTNFHSYAQETKQNYSLHGTIADVIHGESYKGHVHIKDGKIVAIIREGEKLPKGFPKPKLKNVFIYPGLIDNHNHLKFNFLPLWIPSKDTFNNRSEWPELGDYSKGVKEVYRAIYEQSSHCAPFADKSEERIACEVQARCEALAYGEFKALAGGVTAIQGSTSYLDNTSDVSFMGLSKTEGKFADLENRLTACINNGARNLERDPIASESNTIRSTAKGLESSPWRLEDFQLEVIEEINSGLTTAFFIHLGEGIDDVSKQEFTLLRDMKLMRKEMVVIHGTAFGADEFSEMAQNQMSLIWSPLSNLLLYQKTTDVLSAQSKGVNVSLGSDWSMSGSKNLLGELKIAAIVLAQRLGRELTQGDYLNLVQMVTLNAAKAAGLDKVLGSIEVGKWADLLVLKPTQDVTLPMEALVTAQESQVELVVVQGVALYGERKALKSVTGKEVPASSFVSDQCGGDKSFASGYPWDPKQLTEKLAPQMQAAFEQIKSSVKLANGKKAAIKDLLGEAFQKPDPICELNDSRYKDTAAKALTTLK